MKCNIEMELALYEVMMENTAKRNYIWKLIDNLKVIDENKFEKLSGYIAEHFSNCYFNKRGHNVNGIPVGHILDAFTDDLKLALEASSEKNYFKEFLKSDTGEQSKVLHDIKHALDRFENLTHLFLFSNQGAGPTETMKRRIILLTDVKFLGCLLIRISFCFEFDEAVNNLVSLEK